METQQIRTNNLLHFMGTEFFMGEVLFTGKFPA